MTRNIKLTEDQAKSIMNGLIKTPRIGDINYKSAYIDGVLDMYNKIRDAQTKK